jgi:hypothetical protein
LADNTPDSTQDLTPDSFMAAQAKPPVELTPDAFMAGQVDPILANPKRAEDLPTQQQFDQAHAQHLTMHAAPETILDRIKELILGNPHAPEGQTDTPIGRALGISYEDPTKRQTPATDLPMARVSAIAPQDPQSVAGGVAKGAAQFAEGMTTAPNLLMMAGGGALGALGKISGYLPRAVSAAFSLDMLHSAYQQYPAPADQRTDDSRH